MILDPLWLIVRLYALLMFLVLCLADSGVSGRSSGLY